MQQSFARGRSKQVVVEKKRKRAGGPGKDGADGAKGASDGKTKAQNLLAATAKKLGLSEEELIKRQRAIARARAEAAGREADKKREDEERAQRQEEERKALEDQRKREEDARRQAEEDAKRKVEEAEAARLAAAQAAEAKQKAAQEDGKPARKAAPAADKSRDRERERGERTDRGARDDRPARGPRPNRDMPAAPAEPMTALEELGGRVKKKGGPNNLDKPGDQAKAAAPARNKSEPKRRQGKLTIQNLVEDDQDRQRSLASMRRAREREKQRRQGTQAREKVAREVVIPEVITVGELANRMAERAADVVKFLMQQGQMVRAVDSLDADDAQLIVEEFGHTVKRVSAADVEEGFISEDDAEDSKQPRPPVVTIMGHVDHGKTSLLDALRATDVAGGEAGGITQHIGAYQVQLKSGNKITFLDTPGHAAFSSMRSRGAQVTDIVILVVAGDDGIMPQTIEAINHAKAANVPMIVAVNKMDKPDADSMRVQQALLQHEVVVEAMGGDVQVVEVSAKTRMGLEELTEAIILQAEVLELTANPDRSAEGSVIESQIDKGRGPVATVLVGKGTLKRGDIIVAGSHWGKVRALVNERGQQMKEAGPTEPAEILGLDGAPEPGEPFAVVDSEQRARDIVNYRIGLKRERSNTPVGGATASLEQMMARLQQKEVQELPILVKADVQGSAEAITHSVEKIGNEEVRAKVIHAAPGGVSESDVLLAKSSSAPIFAFNVRASKQARELAEKEGVEIRYYSVIYDILDDVKGTLEGLLAPEKRETFIGYAQILEVFNITKVGKVAGCKVTEGVVKRGCGVRLLRNDTVLHEGELSTLKRFKDEVKEVHMGMECGMGFVNYSDLQKGDLIECFEVEEIERKL